jgi:hypothetical protein
MHLLFASMTFASGNRKTCAVGDYMPLEWVLRIGERLTEDFKTKEGIIADTVPQAP